LQNNYIVKNQKSKYIAEVISKHHLVCTFDSKGGRYEPEERLVAGVTTDDKPVKINADDILYVRVSWADPGMTFLAVIGNSWIDYISLIETTSCASDLNSHNNGVFAYRPFSISTIALRTASPSPRNASAASFCVLFTCPETSRGSCATPSFINPDAETAACCAFFCARLTLYVILPGIRQAL